MVPNYVARRGRRVHISSSDTVVRFVEDGDGAHSLYLQDCEASPTFLGVPEEISSLAFYNCSDACVRDALRTFIHTSIYELSIDSANRACAIDEIPPKCAKLDLRLKGGTISGSVSMPPDLISMTICHAAGIESALSTLRRCTSLESVRLDDIRGMTAIDGDAFPERTEGVFWLTVSNCADLVRMTGPFRMRDVRLHVRECPNLYEIEFPARTRTARLSNVGIERLPEEFPGTLLERFEIDSCPNLRGMVRVWPEGTKIVKYSHCPNLHLVHAVDLPRSMEEFAMNWCAPNERDEFYGLVHTKSDETVLVYNEERNGNESRLGALRESRL